MNRSNSLASSINSTTSTSFSPSNPSTLSPLVKLERLLFRLVPLLSSVTDKDEFQLQNHLKLLLQYQVEISKLKEIVLNNSKTEFEYENRILWIENIVDLLDKSIKELEEKLTDKQQDSDNETEVVNEQVTTVNSPQEEEKYEKERNLIDEILPPKPETLLSVPKFTKEAHGEEKPKDSLVFSEEIQSVHDSLTNDLIATVQLIKRNNLHIQKMVKEDDKIINEASGLLATNSETMQKQGKHLKSYSKKAWVSFWKMLLILMFVCFTFIFVYIFIRLT